MSLLEFWGTGKDALQEPCKAVRGSCTILISRGLRNAVVRKRLAPLQAIYARASAACSPHHILHSPMKVFHHHHHHQSLKREGRWGTTDYFATSFSLLMYVHPENIETTLDKNLNKTLKSPIYNSYFWHSCDLEQSQGHQTYNGNVDPE